MSSPADIPFPPGTDALLRQAGMTAPARLTPLSGGMNNRVYRVESDAGACVLKQFFPVSAGERDRFRAEKSFYDFVQGMPSPVATPRALAWSESDRLGLFSWVEGRKLQPADVTESAAEQALAFYLDLNRNRDLPAAQNLLPGAEACFTLQGHFDCVERRVLRVERMPVENDVDRAALAFVQDKLLPAFMELRAAVTLPEAQLQEEIPAADRAISPSDFGFHNALATAETRLVFFDFEYAGWDDPAKFLCDFLCQPAVPIPASLWPLCFKRLAPGRPGGVDPARASLLLPFYQVKWCCILLNEFLPKDDQRRRFALPTEAAGALEKKDRQLAKARASFERIGAAPRLSA
jgi:hypothetical protein